MDFNIQTDGKTTTFTSSLAMWLWHIAIANAPYDTGNLRRSIRLGRNNATKLQYIYNAFDALYLHYLEKGQGPVKKHKGFISNKTVGDMIQELIYFFKTGKTGLLTSLPMTSLSVSKQGVMFYERKLAQSIGWSSRELTADDRQKLSQIRYRFIKKSNMTESIGEEQKERYLYNKNINQRTNMFYLDKQNDKKMNYAMQNLFKKR